MPPEYVVRSTQRPPEFTGAVNGPVWSRAEWLEVAHFHPASSGHRPETRAAVLFDSTAIYVMFQVSDRYVRCTRSDYQSMVCRDSCVEFFFEPKPGLGYFNAEFNAIGTVHISFVEDPTRTPDGFVKFTRIPWSLGSAIRVYHSLDGIIYPEVASALEWTIEATIPLDLIESYTGNLGRLSGQTWRANFYKCADESSHPHWAAWAPIGEEPNFHQPQVFAPIHFA